MINKISFKGREECLTGPIKKEVKKAGKHIEGFISDSSLIPEVKKEIDPSFSSKINEAYKAAHVPYLNKSEAEAVPNFIMPGQQIK